MSSGQVEEECDKLWRSVSVCVCLCRKPTTGRRGRKPTASISMPCDGREVHDGRPSSPPHPSHSVLLLLLCHTHIFAQTHFKGQQMDPHLPQNVSLWCSSLLQSDVKYSWSISLIHSSVRSTGASTRPQRESWWSSLTDVFGLIISAGWTFLFVCSKMLNSLEEKHVWTPSVKNVGCYLKSMSLLLCLSPWLPSFFISCCRFLLPVKLKRTAFCESTSASQLQLPDSPKKWWLAFSSAESRIQPFLSRLFPSASGQCQKKTTVSVLHPGHFQRRCSRGSACKTLESGRTDRFNLKKTSWCVSTCRFKLINSSWGD